MVGRILYYKEFDGEANHMWLVTSYNCDLNRMVTKCLYQTREDNRLWIVSDTIGVTLENLLETKALEYLVRKYDKSLV